MASQLSLGCLPNEVQDMIFAHLGWEVREFTKDRATSRSAYEALWPVVCRELPYVLIRGHSPADGDARIRHHLSRPLRIRNALRTFPKMAISISQLTLAVPVYVTESVYSVHRRIRHVTSPVWHNILLRLQHLRKLRLVALRIDRTQAVLDSTGQFESTRKPAMPTSVAELCIEDIFMCDCENRHDANTFMHCCMSDLVKLFEDLQDIKSLHIRTPRLSRFSVEEICLFPSLVEFRADVLFVNNAVDDHRFTALFQELSLLRCLEVVELRFPWMDGKGDYAVLASGWTSSLSNVRVVRIPLTAFFPAFEQEWYETRTTPLEIEVLFDRRAAVHSINKIGDEIYKPLENRLHYTRDVPQERCPWVEERLEAIDLAVELIERAQGVLRGGAGNYTEMRSLKLVSCEWLEADLGPAWFEDEVQEKNYMWNFGRELAYLEETLNDDRFEYESDLSVEGEKDLDWIEESADEDEEEEDFA